MTTADVRWSHTCHTKLKEERQGKLSYWESSNQCFCCSGSHQVSLAITSLAKPAIPLSGSLVGTTSASSLSPTSQGTIPTTKIFGMQKNWRKNGHKIISTNLSGFQTNISDLAHTFVIANKIGIVARMETYIYETVPDNFGQVGGFSCWYRRDR